MKILVDDLRDIEGMDLIARTFHSGKMACYYFNEHIKHLFIDHDLGSMEPNETGYGLITALLESRSCPPRVTIVSANPVGRDNIGRALEHHGYKKLSPTEYVSRFAE